ncbi:GSCFA family protein [Shimia sp. SK013]|uniref:GSCFA domain-containing protein n=1 Tax=Shimia sp. SK013 TaxID=1389006 RepID=UPI0006B653E0|nr:GSCFA domain-containing protein [Shimia sp. SK013]KPA21854.1 GSCFA family protein [Shimia sp. SK013]
MGEFKKTSPYEDVPSRGYWRSGVAEQDPLAMEGLYRRKFKITRHDAIATAGSCFAQHIARHLKARKFNVSQYEPAPRGMSVELAKKYGFGIYTCRYGNIYTTAQMLQLAREAFGVAEPADRVWEREGRFFDAQRPNVEPNGFETPEQVLRARAGHLAAVKQMLLEMDVFVFTFGLTETWAHKDSGTVFPTAPGTIAGSFDAKVYEFQNHRHGRVLGDFVKLKRLLRRERDKPLKTIVTVSPVPLTATASGQHALAASTYSKSVLRGVAGELFETYRDVDYFPSYELITAPATRGMFFEPNLRSVTETGVNTAMGAFLAQHDPKGGKANVIRKTANVPQSDKNDVVCEEVLLEAFQA